MTTSLRLWRPTVAGAALTALVAASLTLGAGVAQAADSPDGYTNQNYWTNEVGPMVQSGKSVHLGELTVTLKPGAKATDLYPFASVATAPDAKPLPDGVTWAAGAEFFVWDNGLDIANSKVLIPSASEAAYRGWSSFPFSYTDTEENRIAGMVKISDWPGYTQSGYMRFVIGLGTSPRNIRPQQEGVYFYDAILYWDKATGLLSVVGGGSSPEKTATTTTVATSGVTATSATVSATVAPAEATGTVQFTRDGQNVGTPVDVVNGTATTSVSGLAPSTSYTFGASYSGDGTYAASTGSAAAVQTPAAADQSESGIGVTVPEETTTTPSGLKISVKPGAVTLTGAATREQGAAWTASGALGDVTVNDDRRDASAGSWTLSGQASAFAGSGSQIAASNLGWTPRKVGGAGEAGAAASDLSAPQGLATGTASGESNVTTTVGADLALNVPAGTPAGNYQATLTLTLI